MDKFYIGETNDLNTRLRFHNEGKFDLSYTKQANDWVLYFKIECTNRSIARKIEDHIKKGKILKRVINNIQTKFSLIVCTLME